MNKIKTFFMGCLLFVTHLELQAPAEVGSVAEQKTAKDRAKEQKKFNTVGMIDRAKAWWAEKKGDWAKGRWFGKDADHTIAAKHYKDAYELRTGLNLDDVTKTIKDDQDRVAKNQSGIEKEELKSLRSSSDVHGGVRSIIQGYNVEIAAEHGGILDTHLHHLVRDPHDIQGENSRSSSAEQHTHAARLAAKLAKAEVRTGDFKVENIDVHRQIATKHTDIAQDRHAKSVTTGHLLDQAKRLQNIKKELIEKYKKDGISSDVKTKIKKAVDKIDKDLDELWISYRQKYGKQPGIAGLLHFEFLTTKHQLPSGEV